MRYPALHALGRTQHSWERAVKTACQTASLEYDIINNTRPPHRLGHEPGSDDRPAGLAGRAVAAAPPNPRPGPEKKKTDNRSIPRATGPFSVCVGPRVRAAQEISGMVLPRLGSSSHPAALFDNEATRPGLVVPPKQKLLELAEQQLGANLAGIGRRSQCRKTPGRARAKTGSWDWRRECLRLGEGVLVFEEACGILVWAEGRRQDGTQRRRRRAWSIHKLDKYRFPSIRISNRKKGVARDAERWR